MFVTTHTSVVVARILREI